MKTHGILLCNILLFICPIINSTCPSYECSTSGPAVRFPFHLQQHPTINCSHPGFQLTCTAQAFTSLTLPNSGNFYVRDIDYYHQQIVVYDPDDCTPNRLLNLNLSNSPFDINYYYYRNYTFLSCPTDLVQSRNYTTIDCLSNSTTSVLATTVSPSSLAKSISNSCTIITSVPIPISWPYLYDPNGFASDLSKDFRLTWSISGCERTTTGGFENCQTGPSPDDLRIFRIVVLCFTIPAVSFTVGIAMYFWFLDQRRRRSEWAVAHAAMISVHPSATSTPNNGLDDSTIESYAKMVVGESKRIPGPNDIACPICLSDYCANDTLRCIPECQHCFHADCVDEWLRCNSTCPVCRNSPSHA